jgi:phosphate transport system substrate-binding protein
VIFSHVRPPAFELPRSSQPCGSSHEIYFLTDSRHFASVSNRNQLVFFSRKDVGVPHRFSKRSLAPVFLASILLLGLSGCTMKEGADASASSTQAAGGLGNASTANTSAVGGKAELVGKIEIDGSSTVYPISQAVAEEFMKEHPKVAVRVNISGTGGGFKRFKDGDLDICDASRPIAKEELAACQKNNVEFTDLKIGIDGISVVVNPQNTWCKSLSVEQLKQLWQSGSTIKTWNELDPSFPKQRLILYGPDTASGTFDYFTEVICGKRGNSRSDYTPNSNDNVLIQGVQGDAGALGYFGYAYYVLNQQTLRAVPIASGDGQTPVAPSDETILSGQYKPLSRPLFLYVNKKALARPETVAFLKFYLDRGPALVKEVHYIPLPAKEYDESRARLKAALGG